MIAAIVIGVVVYLVLALAVWSSTEDLKPWQQRTLTVLPPVAVAVVVAWAVWKLLWFGGLLIGVAIEKGQRQSASRN